MTTPETAVAEDSKSSVPRLKVVYLERVAPALKEQLSIANAMEIPREYASG